MKNNFQILALEFCQVVEKQTSTTEFLNQIRLLLPQLIHEAFLLPAATPDGSFGREDIPDDISETVSQNFRSLHLAGYWDIFDPLDLEVGEPVFNSLQDDLHDIYRDLKLGLILFEKGQIQNAIWQWKFNFEIHWGAHAVGALRALYFLYQKDSDN